jgi:hypothetical protein
MSNVDVSEIQAGDEIKIKVGFLVSEDWLTVKAWPGSGSLYVGERMNSEQFFFLPSINGQNGLTVIEHRPNIETLDKRVRELYEAKTDAVARRDQAAKEIVQINVTLEATGRALREARKRAVPEYLEGTDDYENAPVGTELEPCGYESKGLFKANDGKWGLAGSNSSGRFFSNELGFRRKVKKWGNN